MYLQTGAGASSSESEIQQLYNIVCKNFFFSGQHLPTQ